MLGNGMIQKYVLGLNLLFLVVALVLCTSPVYCGNLLSLWKIDFMELLFLLIIAYLVWRSYIDRHYRS